ncbi:MAG: MotA/TolQ/ExbB proton channel family protein [Candidatus Syntrophosphaera sp.]
MTLLNIFLRGGVLMYVLVLISIAVIAIVIEKYIHLSQVRKANEKLREDLAGVEDPGEIRKVLESQERSCPLCVMLDKLFNAETTELDLIQNSMESGANLELHKLEKGMGWLSTFAAIAPLIGFLGTVMGMVRVFMNVQGQGNSVDINALAGGIWEALLTTIGGLIVGIVAIVFYNDLVQNMENIAKDMQNHAVESVILLRKVEQED